MLRPVLLFFLVILSIPIFAQKVTDHQQKISPALAALLQKGSFVDSVTVLVYRSENVVVRKGKFISIPSSNYRGLVRATFKQIDELAASEKIWFIDLYVPPKEELTTGSLDLATNKISLTHHHFRNISGSGVLVSIKENRFDTSDIDLTGRYINSGVASFLGTTHASIMATNVAGAGNSSPFGKGVATAAKLSSSDFANLLPDSDTVFYKYGVTVQNHSYGTIIQNYYGIEAAAYDAQVFANPQLVHVFSSGNAGASSATSGVYTGIANVGNLTGNFKWAKNVITVGAIDSFYSVSSLSSRGPSNDGRVKPELVAFGVDGSSGAAALVSGAVAVLQDAYKQRYQSFPSSSLVKALLLNSADDVGIKGIDFVSGYGSLNLYNAIKTLTSNQFTEAVIVPNISKSFPLNVSANVAKLQITLVWNDPAAAPNSSKPLINDLNVKLVNKATGEVLLPWILNTSPHPDSLNTPAKRGIDSISNIEQISLDHPPAGEYTIVVEGLDLIDSQSFSIAWQFENERSFQWSFPTGTDVVQASKQNIVRWQTPDTGLAKMEWSTDGSRWETIASDVELTSGYFKWSTPEVISTAILRMSMPGGQMIVSDTFVISSRSGLSTAFNCSDSFMLYWNNMPVSSYQIYQLNGSYLEPAMLVGDSSVVLYKSNYSSAYYAIAPMIGGKPGLRSNALNYKANGVECYFRNFYLQSQDEQSATLFGSVGTLYNVRSIAIQKLQQQNFITLKLVTNPGTLVFTYDDKALVKGVNTYRLELELVNGSRIYSNQVQAYHFDQSDLIVYPNPTNSATQVNLLTRLAGRMAVTIYNSNGSLVKTFQLNQLINQIETRNLARGLYLIKAVTDEGKISTQKLIVN